VVLLPDPENMGMKHDVLYEQPNSSSLFFEMFYSVTGGAWLQDGEEIVRT